MLTVVEFTVHVERAEVSCGEAARVAQERGVGAVALHVMAELTVRRERPWTLRARQSGSICQ